MKVNVCVIQDHPVFLNKKATLERIEGLVAAHATSDLIVFPESFIPGYPRGFSFGATVGNRTDEGRRLYASYFQESIDLQSEDRLILEKIAAAHGVYLVLGVTEKAGLTGSLYCSMVYLTPHQGLLAVHRKIKPTGTERVIWAEAGGESLVVVQTRIGRLGGLICWENYMPLARMAMFKQGVEIYIAPTADARDSWVTTMQHIALEGRCFVLACNQFIKREHYPEEYRALLSDGPEILSRGGSLIVSPMGQVIAGPLFDQAGALTATLDLEDVVGSKLDFDVVGHYARDDIFDLHIRDLPGLIVEDD